MNSLDNRLTVANEMLSLLGSLQAEPFSAKYDTMKAPSEVSGEEEEGNMYEGKRKTSRSQERTDSEKKRKRK
jgi:hypothetical protein